MTAVMAPPSAGRYGGAMVDVDVAVVGGGISGLSAARELCAAGVSVRLIERDDRCGGVIRTDAAGGFVFDAGPDTLLAHKPAAIALCRELRLDEALVSPLAPRTTYVVRRGHLRALPETSVMGLPTDWKALVRTRAFSWLGKARMAAEPVIPRGGGADESIAAFVGRRFGGEAVRYLAEPLLAGIHRGDASRLSMRALFPTLADAERTHGSVVRSWRALPPAASGRAGSLSLRGGLAQLVDGVRAALPPSVVMSSAEASRVEHDGGFVTRLADGRSIRSRAVVLAVPAYAASPLVTALDGELARLCDTIRYAPSVTVAVAYRSAGVRHPLRGWGLVVPAGEGLRVAAVTWVTSKWPHRAPPGHVLIRASLARSCTSEALSTPDAELQDWVQRDLRTLLGIDAEPVAAKVHRWPRAMPQLEVGHLGRVAAIDERLAKLPGLFVSAAGFRGIGIPDCITDARATARHAVAHVERFTTAG
jgi:oxygen-dependent protoporphyrinogen oxidase